MWIWLGRFLILLLLILLVIVILVWMSKIKLTIMAKKENKDETVEVEARLMYGLFHMHYRIPALGINLLTNSLWVENDHSDNFFTKHTSASEQEVDKDTVDRWFETLKRMIKATTDLKLWMRRTLQRVSVLSLDWSTNIALDDAGHTATLAGALWPLKTTMVGLLTYYIRLKQRPKLFIVPVFGSPPLFATEFKCTAEIRCGDAIYAVLILIYRVLKVKGGLKQWVRLLGKQKK